jgi:hypothetical protein
MIRDCKRSAISISRLTVTGITIVASGTEQGEEIALWGPVRTSGLTITCELQKLNLNSKVTEILRGTLANGMIQGTWEKKGAPTAKAEFRLYPKGVVYS